MTNIESPKGLQAPIDPIRLVEITMLAFPDLLPDSPDLSNLVQYDTEPVIGFNDQELAATHKEFFKRPDAVIEPELDETGKTVGYVYALPIGSYDENRLDETDTAYIYYAAIDPEYQGRALIWNTRARLFKRLYESGFKYVESDVTHENGYADKVFEKYKDNVVEYRDHFSEEFNVMQRFMRIELAPSTIGGLALDKVTSTDE